MGCGDSAPRHLDERGALWMKRIKKRLPLDTSDKEKEKCTALFKKFDEGKHNSLTETECLVGCRKHLDLHKIAPKELPTINKRAFKTASVLRKKADATSGVDPGEFRLFLQYIYDYFELYFMFEMVDTSGDLIVTLDEFRKAIPRLQHWGVRVKDPVEDFKVADTTGKGLHFDEFAEWAMKRYAATQRELKAEQAERDREWAAMEEERTRAAAASVASAAAAAAGENVEGGRRDASGGASPFAAGPAGEASSAVDGANVVVHRDGSAVDGSTLVAAAADANPEDHPGVVPVEAS